VNDTERRIFENIVNKKEVDLLKMFICYDYNEAVFVKANYDISTLVKRLEESGLRAKSKKRQIKEIYNAVHESFLKKYDEKGFFNDIFLTGNYNCVTASALLALVYNEFGIDYQIKETPTHVYLIADPNGIKTLIETTMPVKGVVVFDDKFTKMFVQYLLSNKLISQDEFNRKSVDALFNEYYTKDKSVSLIELGALQYYNLGIFSFNDSKYAQATINFEKAFQLYPSVGIRFMLNNSYLNALSDQSVKRKYNGATLAKYINLSSNDPEAVDYSVNFFNVVADELMLRQPRENEFSGFYNNFRKNVNDSLDLSRINRTYHFSMAYLRYAKMKYGESLSHLTMAYNENPEDIQIQQLTKEVVAKHLFTDTNFAETIDSLDYYFEVFPFLTENPINQRYYTYCYMRVISDAFASNNAKKGELYLEKFREMMKQNNYEFLDQVVVQVYGDVSRYYMQKNRADMAEKILAEGLKWVPDSPILKGKYEMIKQNQGVWKLNPSEHYVVDIQTLPVANDNFGDEFKKKFQKKWRAESVIENSETKKLAASKVFRIEVKSDTKADYLSEGTVDKGTWALRDKSKLLYLIPDKRKNDYLLFKVVLITDNELHLRPYPDQKKASKSIIVLKAEL
jgi:tetratricopeptide (TPR) repeat protein